MWHAPVDTQKTFRRTVGWPGRQRTQLEGCLMLMGPWMQRHGPPCFLWAMQVEQRVLLLQAQVA